MRVHSQEIIVMLEISPVLQRLKEMEARTDVLRGYL